MTVCVWSFQKRWKIYLLIAHYRSELFPSPLPISTIQFQDQFNVLVLPYLTFVAPLTSRGLSCCPPSVLAINQAIFRATAPKYSQLQIRRLTRVSHRQLLARAIVPNFLRNVFVASFDNYDLTVCARGVVTTKCILDAFKCCMDITNTLILSLGRTLVRSFLCLRAHK